MTVSSSSPRPAQHGKELLRASVQIHDGCVVHAAKHRQLIVAVGVLAEHISDLGSDGLIQPVGVPHVLQIHHAPACYGRRDPRVMHLHVVEKGEKGPVGIALVQPLGEGLLDDWTGLLEEPAADLRPLGMGSPAGVDFSNLDVALVGRVNLSADQVIDILPPGLVPRLVDVVEALGEIPFSADVRIGGEEVGLVSGLAERFGRGSRIDPPAIAGRSLSRAPRRASR